MENEISLKLMLRGEREATGPVFACAPRQRQPFSAATLMSFEDLFRYVTTFRPNLIEVRQ